MRWTSLARTVQVKGQRIMNTEAPALKIRGRSRKEGCFSLPSIEQKKVGYAGIA